MRTVSLIVVLAVSLCGQVQSVSLKAPFGPAIRLVSPDGTHALFGIDKTAELWLEDTSTHQRRKVLDATVQTLTLAWSPDSAAFIANDRAASDEETAYIYDVRTLGRLDLRRLILSADPEAARFMPGDKNTVDHCYFHAIRWVDAHHVEVQLHGHSHGELVGTSIRSGDCFDLRYRAGRDGTVQKLAQRVAPISSSVCRE